MGFIGKEYIKKTTEKAFAVEACGNLSWFPKSQCVEMENGWSVPKWVFDKKSGFHIGWNDSLSSHIPEFMQFIIKNRLILSFEQEQFDKFGISIKIMDAGKKPEEYNYHFIATLKNGQQIFAGMKNEAVMCNALHITWTDGWVSFGNLLENMTKILSV